VLEKGKKGSEGNGTVRINFAQTLICDKWEKFCKLRHAKVILLS